MKTAILLVHFGTANKKAIENAIFALENELKKDLKKEYTIINCFMLERISSFLKTKEDITIEYFENVLNQMIINNYKNLIIEPIYFMNGDEYKKIEIITEKYKQYFKSIKIGNPLIFGEQKSLSLSCDKLLDIVSSDIIKPYYYLFVGHGSNKTSNIEYTLLQNRLNQVYTSDAMIGTLEGENNVDFIIESLKKKNIQKVKINLLFMLIGKHVKSDIIHGENSWKNKIEKLGIEVDILEKSLLEYKEIRSIFIDDIKKNLNN